jgi:hypothetical protein
MLWRLALCACWQHWTHGRPPRWPGTPPPMDMGLLIWNSGVVVMPKWPSRAHSLLVGTGASFLKDWNLLASWYNFSFSESLKAVYSSLSSSSSLLTSLLLFCYWWWWCSSVSAPWGSWPSSATSSTSNRSSSWETCYGESYCDSYCGGTSRGAN